MTCPLLRGTSVIVYPTGVGAAVARALARALATVVATAVEIAVLDAAALPPVTPSSMLPAADHSVRLFTHLCRHAWPH